VTDSSHCFCWQHYLFCSTNSVYSIFHCWVFCLASWISVCILAARPAYGMYRPRLPTPPSGAGEWVLIWQAGGERTERREREISTHARSRWPATGGNPPLAQSKSSFIISRLKTVIFLIVCASTDNACKWHFSLFCTKNIYIFYFWTKSILQWQLLTLASVHLNNFTFFLFYTSIRIVVLTVVLLIQPFYFVMHYLWSSCINSFITGNHFGILN